MRSCARLGLLLLVVGMGSGCDTDQPLQLEQGNATLNFEGVAATVRNYNLYQLFEDSNQDGNADDIDGDGLPNVSLFCQTADTSLAPSAPWTFSARVSVIPAGQVQPIAITSDGALSPSANLTRYDTRELTVSGPPPDTIVATHPLGRCSQATTVLCNPDNPGKVCPLFNPSSQNTCRWRGVCSANNSIGCDVSPNTCATQGTCSLNPSIACNPPSNSICVGQSAGTCVSFGTCQGQSVTRRFVFDSATARKLSGAHQEVLAAGPNAFANACCTTASAVGPGSGPVTCTGQVVCQGVPTDFAPGVCPGGDLGPADLDNQGLPYPLTLNKGDTLIVEARRSNVATPIEFPNLSELPQIKATMVFNGAQLLSSELLGNDSSGDAAANPTGGISFYYIVK